MSAWYAAPAANASAKSADALLAVSTALAKGGYRLFATDVENGDVAFLGTMREVPANPVIVMIRLKVANRQITEIENALI